MWSTALVGKNVRGIRPNREELYMHHEKKYFMAQLIFQYNTSLVQLHGEQFKLCTMIVIILHRRIQVL